MNKKKNLSKTELLFLLSPFFLAEVSSKGHLQNELF